MIDTDLRTYLDATGRLRTHYTDTDITVETDLDDAATLMALSLGISALVASLVAKGVSSRNLRVIEDRVVKRSGREVIERIWENPRRRTAGGPVLSNKFAFGGLWTPAAAAYILDGVDYKNQILLEHVVPASTIVKILAAHATAGGDDEGAARILAELFTHVVATRDDDKPLSKVLTDDNENALIDHYAGKRVLDEDQLFAARWSRYLDASERGTLPFSLTDLRTIEEHRAARAAA